LELLAFNAQKIKGHVTLSLTTPPFRGFFSGVVSGRYLGSCMPNFKFASLAILELLAFNAQKIKGHVTLSLTTPPFREFFSGVVSGRYLGSCMPNFKFASLAILELLAFNAQKIKGHVTLATPPFPEFFSGVVSGLYLGSCTRNLKFATLAILELLAFNAQKIKGHVILTASPFREFFSGVMLGL